MAARVTVMCVHEFGILYVFILNMHEFVLNIW